MAIFAKRDGRFGSAQSQAAKLLGVKIQSKAVVDARTVYGADHWSVRAFEIVGGGWLVVSSDDKSLSANVAHGISCAGCPSRDEMYELCADTGVEDDLAAVRREDAEFQRMQAA
ncbi:MAG: hypothetical protein PHZ23_14610 [Acidiphilium sp.]|nr:hypothetical protein [Acidiphilium sp.]